MRSMIIIAALVCSFGTASAQELSQPSPVKGGFMGMLAEHLNFGAAVSYDFVSGQWDQPVAAGFVGDWKINDRLSVRGGSKWVLNSGPNDNFRSTIELVAPIYGYGDK